MQEKMGKLMVNKEKNEENRQERGLQNEENRREREQSEEKASVTYLSVEN